MESSPGKGVRRMAGNYYTPFSVRIPDELLEKVKKLAAMNKRSANKQVEFILERFVTEWGAENGPIAIWDDEA